MPRETWLLVASLGVLLPPFLAFAALGVSAILRLGWSERTTGRVAAVAFVSSLGAALAMDTLFSGLGRSWFEVRLGDWFGVPGYSFPLTLFLDRTSLVVSTLTAGVCGAIGRFSSRYLHRERGYLRFFVLLSLFAGGMELLVLGGSFDLLFAGWEVVGFCSALLIGFFHEREEPAQNALRAFVTYRFCDVGLLLGAILLHHHAGSAELAAIQGAPAAHGWELTATGLLFLLAAAGKSALFPVGGWLPRAMEGPTPSSAIFYGALSVHAGAYLLLRAAPLLREAPLASAAVVALGALTAVTATLVGRTQTDVKSSLAHATMTQVGLIFVEIGLGFTDLALLHLTSHALLRATQLLRAPSALQDLGRIRAVVGHALPTGVHYESLLPERLRAWLYGLALARFHLDELLDRFLVRPLLALAALVVRLERGWARLLAGEHQEASGASIPSTVGGEK
jgi:NADH:ubiquinone oxidoreductase subunit 5 (subunit L)/multisubunit Na+/H+ antiporter MnhA subunit